MSELKQLAITPLTYTTNVLGMDIASVVIGEYTYKFYKQLIELPLEIDPKLWGVRLDVSASKHTITEDGKYQGYREYSGTENDLGDQSQYLKVMRLIYTELENILKKNDNVIIVNNYYGNHKRRSSIYDRWADKLAIKYKLSQFRFETALNTYDEYWRVLMW